MCLEVAASSAEDAIAYAIALSQQTVVTTRNVAYNVPRETLPAGTKRHRDHRFE